MWLFAQNEGINKWLSENPLVLGAGAAVLGLILVGIGISALRTGRAPTKRGRDLEGGQAMAMGVVWLVFGVACLVFAAVKVVSGLR